MKVVIPIFFVGVSLVMAAPAKSADQSGTPEKKRETAWCKTISDDDKAMDKAVTKARESLGFFLAALKADKPDSTDFKVKKCCVDGDNVEHVWIRDITWDGKVFHGRVDNAPLDVHNVKLGARVTIAPDDVSDWMFVKDGKLMGGFTTRVFYSGLSAAEKT
ncbi:MAG TPA: DUF2314 domain-containing protein, partial [Chthoniobacterales bacterium]|nr:DUF2314 domain-containing protein [Chthoniobacterales bacterium]